MRKEAKQFPSEFSDRLPVKNARSGLSSILAHHRDISRRQTVIFMPSYIGWSPNEGSGLMDPVREARFTPVFYPLRHDLQPDFLALQKLLEPFDCCVLLVVHYFGYRVRLPKSLLTSLGVRGVTLIEDWAHDLSRIDESSQHDGNHFALFSLHKWIASQSGGFILGNPGALNDVRCEPMAADDLKVYARSNLKQIFARRWSNFIAVKSQLHGLRGLKFLSDNESDISCPLNVPMLARTKAMRHTLYQTLMAHDIYPTSLYHTLDHQLDQGMFPDSFDISNRIINLPIHQDCSETELQEMIDLIRKWDDQS